MSPEVGVADRDHSPPDSERAALAGRHYVIPEDVKEVAMPALAHRITLKPEMWLRQTHSSTIVADVLARVPAPASGALPTYSEGLAGAGAPAPRSGVDPYRYTAPPPRS